MPLLINDFAHMFQRRTLGPITEQEAHHLLPIDLKVTQNHDHALLLLHGFASSPAVYRAMMPLISGYDRIVCPVLPGHGESIAALSKTTAYDWQHHATKTCEELVSSYTFVTVVGLSLGGVLAIELSKLFKLHHLFLLAPALKLYYPTRLALPCARLLQVLGIKTLPNYSGDLYSDRYQEWSYRQLPLTTIIEILALIQAQTITTLSCPTDIYLGRYDTVVNVKYLAKHYDKQAGIAVHWLSDSAHILPLDGDLETIAQAISR